MVTPAQIKYLAAILIAAILALAMWQVYDTIYDYGYNTAKAEYIAEQNKKVDQVQATITSLVAATTNYNKSLMHDISTIQSSLNGKTLVVYKDGKCVLTQEYIDARSEAIKRANQK